MSQGYAGPAPVDATRYDVVVRPRHLSVEQDHVPARCSAWHRQHPAKRHHQDFLDRGGRLHATDAGCLNLWNEFPPQYGRTRLGTRLPVRARIDGYGRGAAAAVLQVEEVAVGEGAIARQHACRRIVSFIMPGPVRASTSLQRRSKEDVDGRDKPGRDGMGGGCLVKPAHSRASGNPGRHMSLCKLLWTPAFAGVSGIPGIAIDTFAGMSG